MCESYLQILSFGVVAKIVLPKFNQLFEDQKGKIVYI